MTILRSTPATISAAWYEGQGLADPGAVTVTVRRAYGPVVKPAEVAAGTGAAVRTTNLQAAQTAQLDQLVATWVSPTHGTATTYHEIIGGQYVALATLRAERDLADAAVYTLADLEDARLWWRDLVEEFCHQSFVPRFRMETIGYRRGRRPLRLGRPHVRQVLHASLDGVAVDATGWDVAVNDSAVTGHTLGSGRLVVAYEHGLDQPDRDLYEAGITAMRSKIMTDKSGRASRQILVSTQLGTVRLAQPGKDRPTGIPEVDASLQRHRYLPVMVG